MTIDTKSLFVKRFSDEVSGLYPTSGHELPFPMDMWYGKKVLFGRVDEQLNVVNISSEAKKQKLKLVTSPSQYENMFGGVLAFDFVASAFSDLKAHFARAMAGGKLSQSGVLLSLKPINGFSDPNLLYNTYVTQIFSTFSNVYLDPVERSREVLDFDGYLKMFMKFIKEYGSDTPVTRTYFTKTNFCSPLISGLIIELAAENVNDDDAKDVWTEDLNFMFLVKAARKFGFLVDEHAPWRLVANLASPAMQRYWWRSQFAPSNDTIATEDVEEILGAGCLDDEAMQNLADWLSKPYGENPTGPTFEWFLDPITVQAFFKNSFTRTCLLDIPDLKFNLLKFYNEFAVENPRVRVVDTKKCLYGLAADRKRLEILTRETTTSEEVEKKYDAYYWLEVYFHIRLLEEQRHMSKAKIKRTLRNVKSILKRLDKNTAVMYISEVVQGFPKRVRTVPTRTVALDVASDEDAES
jgi:hypothetical protein